MGILQRLSGSNISPTKLAYRQNKLPQIGYATSAKARSVDPYGGRSYDEWIRSGAFMESGDSASGEAVNETTAYKVSVLFRCITLLAETVAALPFCLLTKTELGGKDTAPHPLNDVYKAEPNDFQTWFDFFFHLMAQAILHGNGYAYIRRNGFGRPIGYEMLSNSDCMPFYARHNLDDTTLYYYVFGKITEKEDIIHIKAMGYDGVIGRALLEMANEAIGVNLSQQKYTGSLYANGLNLQGVLEHPMTLSDSAAIRLKKQMDKYKGANNSNDTMLLEEGLIYKSIGITPNDADHYVGRKFSIEEICRFVGVPLHKVASLDKATNNNIEHQDLEFYKTGVMPWLTRIEQEFNRKTLVRKEKGVVFHEFDVNLLLRGDTKATMERVKGVFDKGGMTPDEVRVAAGMNPMGTEAMQKTYIQQAMAPLDLLTDLIAAGGIKAIKSEAASGDAPEVEEEVEEVEEI
jgi:HK97 family phage portal protein